jgi:hypothetical protein
MDNTAADKAVHVHAAATVAGAANGNCPNGLPYCFAPDTPALASNVNWNFAQLKEWLEQKVGTSGTAAVTMTSTLNVTGQATLTGGASVTGATAHRGEVRVQSGSTSNAATAAGKPLFISAILGDGNAVQTGNIEFRHDNLTQGIGFGFNTIYATGSNPNQDLGLKARGTGSVQVYSTMKAGQILSSDGDSQSPVILPPNFCVIVPQGATCPTGWNGPQGIRWDTEDDGNGDSVGSQVGVNCGNSSICMTFCCRGDSYTF